MRSIVTYPSADYIFASSFAVVQRHLNNLTTQACRASGTVHIAAFLSSIVRLENPT